MEGLGSHDPRWIGGYRLLGRLGEGGMGRVYLARSERGRTVAVKMVKANLARQPDFRRRFALEIAAARRVGSGSHQGAARGEAWTAPVLDADTEAAEPWVATGYIAGPSLSQVVDEDYGPLPEGTVLALATGLVQALTGIHAAGLVHRDLKPSNVLITFDGPRVIDFGIARAVDAALQSSGGLTGTGAVIGSPGFMSPEQVRGTPVTAACDIFCLGSVLAYAATGRMPFGTADSGIHALMFRIAEEEPDLTGIEGPLRDLIAACLAKKPEDRPTLQALAARTGEEISGTWLPGEVLAQLGRHAVRLLDSEDPETAAAVPDATPGGPEAGTGAGTGAGPGTATPGGGHGGSRGAPSTPPPNAPGSPGTPPPAPGTPPPGTPPPGTAPQGPYASPGIPPPTGFGGPGGPLGPGGPRGAGPTAAPRPGPYGYPQQSWTTAAGPATPQHTGYQHLSPYGPRPGPGQGTGPHPGGPPPGPPRSPRGLATGTWLMLAVVLLWLAVDLIYCFSTYAALTGYGSESYPSLADGYDSLKSASVTLEIFSVLIGLVVVTLWLMWFWRVRMNAEAFQPRRVRHGPGMAIGAWFIPVANLWIPKQITDDIWSAGSPAASGGPPWNGGRPSRPGILNGWWTMCVISFMVAFTVGWENWYDADTMREAQGWLVWGVVTDLLTVPAAILAIQVVLRITRQQENRMSSAGG